MFSAELPFFFLLQKATKRIFKLLPMILASRFGRFESIQILAPITLPFNNNNIYYPIKTLLLQCYET